MLVRGTFDLYRSDPFPSKAVNVINLDAYRYFVNKEAFGFHRRLSIPKFLLFRSIIILLATLGR